MRPRESPGDALPDSDLDVWDSILLPQAAHAGKDNWKGWCEIESEPVSHCRYVFGLRRPHLTLQRPISI